MLRLFRTREPPDRFDIAVGGEIYTIAVRRLKASRRYTLRVRTAQRDIVLSMPLRGNMTAAKAFAERHAGWIAARLGRLDDGVRFADGVELPLRGVLHRIAHRPAARGTVKAEAGEPPVLAVAGDLPHLPRRLTDWLKRQALKDLTAAVERHTAAIGAKHGPISVKDTSSRWGSCSSSGALAFSWRLILAPPFVLDYLAAHEVAHLKEMNHSQRFWRLCEMLCPRTKEAKAWLRLHGAGLHRYG